MRICCVIDLLLTFSGNLQDIKLKICGGGENIEIKLIKHREYVDFH